jgi:hypothetical protein
LLPETGVASKSNRAASVAYRQSGSRQSLIAKKWSNEMTMRLAVFAVVWISFIALNSLAGPMTGQTEEPRPRASQTPSPSRSPSKEEAKKTGLELDVAHKPEPRPTVKSNLRELVTHHNQGSSAQGAEARPSGAPFPASSSRSNTNTAKQSTKKPSEKPEPRPPSSPKPKKNVQPDE